MKIKTSELTGLPLDWAVDWSLSGTPLEVHSRTDGSYCLAHNGIPFMSLPKFSTEWSKGGPIIERECINVLTASDPSKGWFAQLGMRSTTKGLHKQYGSTPLIAAMRCYVTSKLGEEVEVPDELMEGGL